MENKVSTQRPQHLEWHETLEIHELTAFQSIGLIKIKKAYAEVTEPALKELYFQAIKGLSTNTLELITFLYIKLLLQKDSLDISYLIPNYNN